MDGGGGGETKTSRDCKSGLISEEGEMNVIFLMKWYSQCRYKMNGNNNLIVVSNIRTAESKKTDNNNNL